VSGREERSAAEREAARLERERRRAERRKTNGSPSPAAAGGDVPPHEPTTAEPFEDELFAHGQLEHEELDDEPFEPYVVSDQRGDDSGHPDDDDDSGQPDDDDDSGHPDELPSGTRRVAGARRVRLRGERPDGRRRDPAGRTRVRRRTSWRGRAASILVLGLAAALIWFLVELFQPFHGSPHGSIRVTIPAHASSGQIGDLLERDGVISSSFFFQLRATLAGERGDLRSGTYHMQLGMSYGSVLKMLTTAPKAASVTDLTITEGKTRRQTDALLRAEGIHGSYVAATRHSPLLDPHRYGAPRHTPSLEGFLFPSTYQLREPIKISALVADQLKTFKAQFRKVKLGFARSKHLTPYDVLTIASMIEAEAATAHDRPLISSVIYNRLRDRMPLQIDATTRYATGNYSRPLTVSELNSPSPYNTRIHKGLPPTPIDNPGMAAIQAAAHPAHTNYLYFVVKPCGNGEQAFASSFQKFEKLAQQYQQARAQRGGHSPSHC
jgi:uncharacterized YceG family protein